MKPTSLSFRLILIASVFAFTACSTPTTSTGPESNAPKSSHGSVSPADVDIATGGLAKFKSETEDLARKIRADTALTSAQKNDAEKLYIEARAAVEDWITRVKTGLALGLDEKTILRRNQAAFDTAASQAQKFVEFVNKLYVSGAISPGTFTLIGEVQKILSAAWNDIFKFITAEDAKAVERRKQIVAILDTLRWKAYRDL